MLETETQDRVGAYMLTKPLARGVLGDRTLALHAQNLTSHVIHMIKAAAGDPRDAWTACCMKALTECRRLKHSHTLEVEAFDSLRPGEVWVATPFTGDQDGLVPLDLFLRRKGGFLGLDEGKRAIEQLMAAVCAGHELGMSHGELSMREVQVDRRGSVHVEHYGVARALGAGVHQTLAEAQAAEVRSVFEIGYQFVTGLRVEQPIIPASRVLLDAHHSWDDLFETGLGNPGFTSAAHAMSAIQGCKLNRDSAGKRVGSALRAMLPV